MDGDRFPLPIGDAGSLLHLLREYARDPSSAPEDWHGFLDEFLDVGELDRIEMELVCRKLVEKPYDVAFSTAGTRRSDADETVERMQGAMVALAYRLRGHLAADLDPLDLAKPPELIELEAAGQGLDNLRGIVSGSNGEHGTTVEQHIERLRGIYCGTMAAEFEHIHDTKRRQWFEAAFEASVTRELDRSRRDTIVRSLIAASTFEDFLSAKFAAKKTFGLRGAEGQIVFLDALLEAAAGANIDEIVMGGMHRGRLNVLVNILGKPPQELFSEFHDRDQRADLNRRSGDVPYHLGYSAEREIAGKTIRIMLAPHPSHLIAVAPVSLGRARAKQDLRSSRERRKTMCVLLHTDAAFAGQGLTAELFQLSNLQGYSVAGAIHLVVNNQIGFTTDPHCAGSARYCTDVAKMVEVPVIHVNGDDPEALVRAAALAVSYRQEFARDIVIDLVCYRRRGHHELDEPRLSQPLMYGRIDRHPDVWTRYRQTLKDRGELDDELVERNSSDCRQRLETALQEAPRYQTSREPWLEGLWREISPADEAGVLTPVETGCPLEQLRELGERLTEVPGEMSLDRRVSRFLDARRETVRAGSAVNWSTAEALAFATLLLNATPVRIVGQDSVRGAFAQRHLALHDQSTGRIHFSHNNLSADQAPLEAVNSPLAEYATLGFEYGYSLVDPGKLVIWEAQFGDFCNGAQIIVDQFIATAEEKWSRMSGLVLLLPHGLEGQGPDHSSARPERFLQLCAKANMIVVNCSTPANYFHLLRRQVLARWRKPLVVMAPKSLLRHKEAVSDLVEFGPGRAFQPVIGDARFERGKPGLRRLVLCSGKFYYELRAAQAKSRRDDVAIVRMEQLYPFPGGAMLEQLARFSAAEVVWCQEEPENFGAWSYVRPKLDALLGKSHAPGTTIRYVGREAQSAAAGGSLRRHGQENLAIAAEALG